METNSNKVLLAILDGWGIGQKPEADAILQADTPFFDQLMERYPHSTLTTFGEAVGLPEGQMGNSEVGHLNIGSGRVVYQELARINKSVREKELHTHAVLLNALAYARQENKAIHLMGLVSDGGVHAHIEHLKALCDIAAEHGSAKTYVHAFTDGRDTDPKSGRGFLLELSEHIQGLPVQIASVIGRYYAMDRDKRWERVKLAYDLLVHGAGEACADLFACLDARYKAGETDEFLQPIVMTDEAGQPLGRIQAGDVLICFNFRTDRPREISEVLSQRDFPEYGMKKIPLRYLTMTRYDDTFKDIEVLFSKDDLAMTLGEVLEKAKKTQVRIAETEKYPHVTFFFNGGREKEFEGERRILVPSPKVPTYDLQPEMSAVGITEAIVEDIRTNQPDFICLNYANTDMVGHTGVFEAAMKAASTVDTCLKELIETALEFGYHCLIIADHGNSDYLINEDGTPNTAHSMNPVPCIYVARGAESWRVSDGKLADIAPTILSLMGISIDPLMDGNKLLRPN
jgi:2,3-bisphosphoglycerate-independent phosphoglycerate mutase